VEAKILPVEDSPDIEHNLATVWTQTPRIHFVTRTVQTTETMRNGYRDRENAPISALVNTRGRPQHDYNQYNLHGYNEYHRYASPSPRFRGRNATPARRRY
jgi:hypothetical protein